ncbi:hypothetical protein COV12_00825 [Candidatus Woesearchaeota archaeon CG10_big_fil_rev_8_21_14_0_10_32_24]|nr:MAG: hypothetical protein COV12_00825 [Candidatus Woesearchaeota archaeon CG10_big_fil_rev_8_21_14_0_10_32_24]
MVNLSQKNIGYGIVGFAIILIVLLTFVKINQDTEEVLLCQAIDGNPNIGMSECPAHNSSGSWVLTLAFGVTAVILTIGLYLVFVQPPETKKIIESDFKNVRVEELDEEEQKIYHLLKEHEGSMYQSDLVKKTEMSKVQITRVLDKMELHKILERKRRGMANLVVLK